MMVQQKNSLLVVMAVSVAALVVLHGCSNSAPRQAGLNIVQAVEEAQRLHDRAVAMLANELFTIGGEMAPIQTLAKKKYGISDVAWPVMPVNPKAAAALTQAEQMLRKALRDNADAGDAEMSLGRQMLGRVLALRGHCHRLEAAACRGAAERAVAETYRCVGAISAQSALVTYVGKLDSMSDADVQAAQAAAAKKAGDLQTAIEAKTRAIAATRSRRDALREKILSLNTQARQARQKSDLERGDEHMKLFDEAMALEREATTVSFDVQKAEFEMALAALAVTELDKERSLADKQAGICKDVMKERSDSAAVRGQVRKVAEATLAAAWTRAEKALSEAAGAWATLREAATKAVACCDDAAKSFKSARKGVGNDRGEGLLASEAAARAAAGWIESELLSAGRQASTMAADLTAACIRQKRTLSADVAKIREFAGDLVKLRESAGAKFEAAAKLYEDAQRKGRGVHRWLYKAHAANAYYWTAKLRKDSTALAKAREIVAEVLKDKRESPLLKSVVQLERRIAQAQE